jgi:hypothetical protein
LSNRFTNTFSVTTLDQSDQNQTEVSFNVSSPLPGYWFSASFLDNYNQACAISLSVTVKLLQLTTESITILAQDLNVHPFKSIFKYYSQTTNGPLIFVIKNINNTAVCSFTGLFRQSALPDIYDYSNNDDFINTTNISSQFKVDNPLANTWYYLNIIAGCEFSINVSQSNENSPKLISTKRSISPLLFNLIYYLDEPKLDNKTIYFGLDEEKTSFVEFLTDFENIGGGFNLILKTYLTTNKSNSIPGFFNESLCKLQKPVFSCRINI